MVKKFKRNVLSEKVITEKQDEVVAVGTKPKDVQDDCKKASDKWRTRKSM